MAGKVTVGTVYLKVQPDLDGFRRKVENGTKGLNDVELDVNPDLDGFRQKVKAATKGMKATVDVDADTKGIREKVKAAAKDVSDRAVSMRADLDTSWADKELKEWSKRFSKRNATGVTMLKVDVDRNNISNVEDLVHKGVSREPVKIRFALQRDQLNKAIGDVRKSLKEFGPGTKRSHQLFLGTSPKDSGSQRKQIAFLDQVKARVDKLKKPVSSPWENWSGKKLKTLTVGVGDLERTVNQLKYRTQDAWKLNGLRNGDTSALSDQLKDLHKIYEQFKKLHQKSKETGDGFPTGYLDLTKRVTKFQKDLEQIDKARGKMMDKWTREAYKPVDYGNLTPDFLKRVSPLDNQVHKRAVREIRKEIYSAKFLNLKSVKEAQKGLAQVRKAYADTADQVQRANQKIREASKGAATGFNGTRIGREIQAVKQYRRIMKNASDKDALGGSKREQLTDRLTVLRKQLTVHKENIKEVVKETRKISVENRKASSSFSKLGKQAKNTGFGGKRRKGLKTIDEVGTERFAGLSRIGWMISAIGAIAAPVVQLVSGLAASLPALGGAALAALGVTLLGLDGIKDAAQEAAPALERAKEAVSGVFRTRMAPQFKQLGKLLDDITPQMETMAHGMSDFSQGLTDGLTSTTGTGNIQKLLENSAGLFSKMKPFAEDFTEGLLEMAGAGSETFPSLADGMNRFGSSFRENIADLTESGQLQDAIQATYDVVGSLGTNLGRILRSGIETAPSMADSLIPLFDGLADGVEGIMPLLSSFSEFVGPTLGTALSELGDLAAGATPGLTSFFQGVTPGLSDFISGAADLGAVPLGALSSFLGGLGPGMGDTLSMVGSGFSNLAGGINDFAGANTEGAIGSLEEVTGSFGTALGELLPSLFGQYNDIADELVAPDPADYEGFLGFLSFFYDDYIYSIKTGTKQMTDAISESGRERKQAMVDSFSDMEQGFIQPLTAFKQNIESSARMISSQLKVDIKPELELLSEASTEEDVARVKDQIEEKLKNGLSAMESSVDITIDPKVNLQGAIDNLSSSVDGPIADLKTTIEQFKVNAQAIAGEVGIDISPQIRILEDASTATQFTDVAQGIIDQIKAGVDTTPTEIDPNLTVNQSAPLDTTGVTDGVKTQLETDINSALSGMDVDMSGTATAISTELGNALSGVDVPMDGLVNSVQGEIDGLVTAVSGKFGEITTAAQSEGTAASVAFSGAMAAMSSASTGIVSGMAGSIQSALTMDLSANGAAVGNSFAAGIESTVGRVRAAAFSLAAAVSLFMPHSPADEGPLSGKGWVDRSGIAVGVEFAEGIRSTVGEVSDATQLVAGAVNDQLSDFQIAPQANMEAFKKDAVLQPVLESNAKKIANFRKREEERAEKHNERMGKIDENKSKDDKKEEQRVKAREDLAKQSAEAYDKLLESLEEPDYGKIDRSIQGYWIDGYKDVFKDALKSSMSAADFTGSLQRAVKGATSQVRETLGDHPILAQVEANVDSDAFHWAVYNAIEESGIHEVPINLAVANVDQFKRDLGMGDGVLSRALDQAISFDPGRSDARRYEEQKEEVHYHVTDMEEAIRLHQQAQRKELMKIPR